MAGTRISAGDLTAVDELVSDDFVEHEQVPGLAPGKAGVRQLFGMFHSAFDHAEHWGVMDAAGMMQQLTAP